MLRSIEPEEQAAPYVEGEYGAARSQAIVPAVARDELETTPLPADHPRWVRDATAVSQRAREIVETLKPIVLRVLCFWDHRVRSIRIGEHRVNVDPSGSYRIGY
jgi:hypothetical protein